MLLNFHVWVSLGWDEDSRGRPCSNKQQIDFLFIGFSGAGLGVGGIKIYIDTFSAEQENLISVGSFVSNLLGGPNADFFHGTLCG